MKHWKHVVLTTALSGTGFFGGDTALETPQVRPQLLSSFGYSERDTSPEAVIKGAKLLHERINSGSLAPYASDAVFDAGKVPYKVVEHTPRTLALVQ